MESTVKEHELDQMLRFQQIRELSSQEQDAPSQAPVSRSQYRKPIKNAYSDSDSQDSSLQKGKGTILLPPRPTKGKTVLQKAQVQIKWTKQDTTEIDILAKLQGNDAKSKKIMELANKYKSLNIAYEKQRTLRRGLQEQLNSTMKATQQQKKMNESRKLQKSRQKSNQKKSQANNAQYEKKIMDMRLKNQNLKTQLNKAHRLIARQIGQQFDIDKALGQQNGWKGRQQKIQKLKARVKQLQDRLAAGGANVSHMSGFSQLTIQPKTQNPLSATRMSSMADNKRKQLQSLKVQTQALRSQNQSLQSKVKALNSRKINLQTQLRDIKADFDKKKQIFIQKSDNDDRFIALLKQQNEKLKKDEKVVTKVVYKDSQKSGQSDLIKKQLTVVKRQLKELQKQNSQLRAANNELKQSKQQVLKVKQTNPIRDISVDKKKQLQDQYVKGNKYLKRLSAEDEQQIYRTWKQSKTNL